LIGLVGVIWNRRNFLVLLLCIELIFFAISLNFVLAKIFVGAVIYTSQFL
jgi:NADH:ubiquinone oxidoreductase subunit K